MRINLPTEEPGTRKFHSPKKFSSVIPALREKTHAVSPPPLSYEELRIKLAVEAFYDCRFEESAELLSDLCKKAKNRYIRITALRIECSNCIFLGNVRRFLSCYESLSEELKNDFPYKNEMSSHIHEIDATLGNSGYFKNRMHIDPGYKYDTSYLPHLAALNTISLFFSIDKNFHPKSLDSYEINCAFVDSTDNYVDSQTVHLYLGNVYSILGISDRAFYHLLRALEIAKKYNLYYAVAAQYYYFKDAFEPVLKSFPEDFTEKFLRISSEIHVRYVKFMNLISDNGFFILMGNNEYIYVLYALQGYRNKEIAKMLNISEKTVSNKYSEIYDRLGVTGKKELIELYHQSVFEKNNIF